jgi:hypothetical protein
MCAVVVVVALQVVNTTLQEEKVWLVGSLLENQENASGPADTNLIDFCLYNVLYGGLIQTPFRLYIKAPIQSVFTIMLIDKGAVAIG